MISHNLQVLQEEAISFFGLDQSTDILPGTVLKKSSPSKMTVVTSSNKSGHITVTVQSVPGIASLSLYTVSGRMVYALPDVYSSKGIYSFVINKSNQTSLRQTSCLFIGKVLLDGADAGAFKCTL